MKINIRVDLLPSGYFSAYDDLTYDCDHDGTGFFSTCPIGYGDTAWEAIGDLLCEMQEHAEEREAAEQAARFRKKSRANEG